LRFRFVSRRADFGDHNHRPKTLRISAMDGDSFARARADAESD
jgi:hypothetical protein